eukprot:TRINITY_DN9620_c0_g6_i4.p1 TRINITY_DN9620_c0_g6~~TRINITY_DN9620_c0_g6_i4.p1  ORF type:complete len:450 (+),score=61.11 TRINITY_DN9620_c0_g6_i4:263-1612(+)
MNVDLEASQQQVALSNPLASPLIEGSAVLKATPEKKPHLIFSIARTNEGKVGDKETVNLESAQPQLDAAESSSPANALGIKSLRKVTAAVPNDDAKTQPATPDNEESVTDSYKSKTTLQGNEAMREETAVMERGKFRPSILYGHEATVRGTPQFEKAMSEFLLHSYQAISVIKRLKPVPQQLIDANKVTLPHTSSISLRKRVEKGTIVFDLDETLAHCTVQNVHLSDYHVTVAESGVETPVGVNIRPHAISCLTELAKHFELIVFTASHSSYADCVIDILDPERKLFAGRLFRSSCIQTENGLFIKDLRVLNRCLSKLVLVDNSVFSFAFQLDNGIPIVPFYDDKTDSVLPKLTEYLLSLREMEDYRLGNVRKFGLRYLHDSNVQSFLKYHILLSRHYLVGTQQLAASKKRDADPVADPPVRKRVKESECRNLVNVVNIIDFNKCYIWM